MTPGKVPTKTEAPAVAGATPSAAGQSWSFDADPPGSVPERAKVFDGKWGVRAESDAPSQPNALCQTGSAEFPAIALSDATFPDLTVTTRFKPISGRSDQAGGIIFRVQDKDNYYVLRANALENNVNLYKYMYGRRSTIKEGSAKVVSGQWQELKVEASGNLFRGYLNGQAVVEATDDSFKSGRVGLWTKADSVTCFDNLEARPQ